MPLVFRKQPSGAAAAGTGSASAGRGEYELVGESGGVNARALREHGFIWQTPFGLKETEIALSNQGGKWRLRRTASVPHIHRQAATLGLLPRPVRDERRVSHGQPIVLEDRYLLDVVVGLVSVEDGMATVRPDTFTGRSGTAADVAHSVNLPAADRFRRLRLLWDHLERLPDRVAEAVVAHRQSIVPTSVIGADAERSVRTVIDTLEDLDLPDYVPGSDPLATLEFLAGLTQLVELPVPTQAPPDSPEIRLRLETAWRLQKDRGKAHNDFKNAVQKAYNHTCAFCGFTALRLPGLKPFGVDAAHILPWSTYDIDHVTNGIQLCKRDHWLFDRHVVLLRFDSGAYSVKLNGRFAGGITDESTLRAIRRAVGVIPNERLPKPSERPNPEFIEKLYEGLDEEATELPLPDES